MFVTAWPKYAYALRSRRGHHHDTLGLVEAVAEPFHTWGVDAVVHRGGFVTAVSAAAFDGEFAFHAVRGNTDGESGLESTVGELGTYHGDMVERTLDVGELGVYHGTSEAILDAFVASANDDCIYQRHTHERNRGR